MLKIVRKLQIYVRQRFVLEYMGLWKCDFVIFGIFLFPTFFLFSNFQVKLHFRVVFHNWYFNNYHYFTLPLIRVTYAKLWWNNMARSTTCTFAINDEFYLKFSEVKLICLYFWVMLKLLFKLSYFTRKLYVKK